MEDGGCIPMYAGIKEHSERGYLGALENYNAKVAELAEIGVDLIHPEGGPPFDLAHDGPPSSGGSESQIENLRFQI